MLGQWLTRLAVVSFSLRVMVAMAEIVYKQNVTVSSILEASSASNETHIAPHMQASDFV